MRQFAEGRCPGPSIDNPHFEQLQAERPQAVESAVKRGLVEMLSAKGRLAEADNYIEILESIDDGRHRLAGKRDLVCPGRHVAFIDL